jgi:hypothetical protein
MVVFMLDSLMDRCKDAIVTEDLDPGCSARASKWPRAAR